jgi:hypothetical protein
MEPILSKHKLQQLIDMKDLKEAPTGLTREKDFEEYEKCRLRKNLNLLPLQTCSPCRIIQEQRQLSKYSHRCRSANCYTLKLIPQIRKNIYNKKKIDYHQIRRLVLSDIKGTAYSTSCWCDPLP